jgi:hypothetical protein
MSWHNGQALGLHEPSQRGDGACAECGQPSPHHTVLHVAILARFPVPWTPLTLAGALSTARLWPSIGPEHDLITAGRMEWETRAS